MKQEDSHKEVANNRSGFREVLANKNFFRLWVGQIVASIGDRFYQFAILHVVIILGTEAVDTGVGKESARILFFGMLPTVLFFPWLGQIVDRFSRRDVMIFTDLMRAACVMMMLLVWQLYEDPKLMYFFIALAGLMNGLFIPARQASVPLLVEGRQLIRANALVTVVGIVASLLGALAGVYVAVFGAQSSFIITSLGFLFSGWMLSRIKDPLRLKEKVSLRAQWGHMQEILRSVLGDRIVRFLFFFSGGTQFITGLFFIFVLEYTVDQMDLSWLNHFVEWFKNLAVSFNFKEPTFNVDLLALVFLLCCTGAGLICGVAISGKFYRFAHWEGLPIVMFGLLGGGFIMFSQIETFPLAMLASVVIGCTAALLNIPIDSRLQAHVHDHTHGRVFAAKTAWMHICFLLAMLLNLDGRILEWQGPQTMLLYLGSFCMVACLLIALNYRDTLGKFWEADDD
ncbi:MAG: MFS transporter [Verrucomicrobiota bacterium]